MEPISVLGGGLLLIQTGPSIDVTTGNVVLNVVSGAVGAFLTTLLVGAILVALVPEYTERTMAKVVDEPLGSFGYGVVILLLLLLVTFVLAITIIGLLLAIPLVIVTYLVWAIGSAIAFLAIADRLVGREDGWTKPLLVAAGINGLLAVTVIGGLVSFAVGAAGFGAVLREYL